MATSGSKVGTGIVAAPRLCKTLVQSPSRRWTGTRHARMHPPACPVAQPCPGRRGWCLQDICLVPTSALHPGPGSISPVPAPSPWERAGWRPTACPRGISNTPGLCGRSRVELFRDCCEQPLQCCARTNPRTALLIRDKSKNPAQAGSRRRGPVICYSPCRLPRCLCFATRGTVGLIFPCRLHREPGAFLENTF